MLEAQLGQEGKAEATLARVRRKASRQSGGTGRTGHAQGGQRRAERPRSASLQDALEKCDRADPAGSLRRDRRVAQALLVDNQLLAARAHLVLQVGMGGGKDQRPLQLLMRLEQLAQRAAAGQAGHAAAGTAPDDALWKNSFNTAIEPALRGAWRLARQESYRAGRQGRRLARHLAQHRDAALVAGRHAGRDRSLAQVCLRSDPAGRRGRGRSAGPVARQRERRPGRPGDDRIRRQRRRRAASAARRQPALAANADRSGPIGHARGAAAQGRLVAGRSRDSPAT